MRKRFWMPGLVLFMTFIMSACGAEQKRESAKADESTTEQSIAAAELTTEDLSVTKEDAMLKSENTLEQENKDENWSGEELTPEVLEGMSEEELMAYLMQFLPVVSRKADYTQPILAALAALPEEMSESALKQKDVDCDTLQWFNATYAMFLESQRMNYHRIGGYNDENDEDRPFLLIGLESSWGITDRASAIDTLYWLASEGHADGFSAEVQQMALYGLLEMSEEQIRESILEQVDGKNFTEENVDLLVEYFAQIKGVYDICGEDGIDAWDYCRFMQIAGDSYYAGFLTLEETLTLQLEAGRAIQQQFDSWETMNQSYLQGYIYWVHDDYAASQRQKAYEGLLQKEDCPWKVLDFDMALEKFW